MGYLNRLGIVIGDKNSASAIFEELFPDFLSINYNNPSEYIEECWKKYEEYVGIKNLDSNSTNGKIFEYVLATLFIREGIIPFYLEAKVAFVPNVKFDLLLYTKECGPICISAKTSLRERYKQADLEAIALKYVHRKSQTYLITLNKEEVLNNRQKIKTGDLIGLNDIIYAKGEEFDELINRLKKGYEFSEAGEVKIIQASQIITHSKIEELRKVKVISDKL